MKTVLLAGGLGSRLSEETEILPKPLVNIGEMPIIWHIMKIYSYHGLNDFVICLGYKGNLIKKFFDDYRMLFNDVEFNFRDNSVKFISNKSIPWKVTLIDTGQHTMTGGRLKLVKKYTDNETFCMTYGDGVSNLNIKSLISHHKKNSKLATVLGVRPEGRYGSLLTKGNNVLSFGEKQDNKNVYVNGGFFVLESGIFNFIKSKKTFWEKEPLENLAKKNQLSVYKYHGFWKSMDTLRDKKQLNEMYNQNIFKWLK